MQVEKRGVTSCKLMSFVGPWWARCVPFSRKNWHGPCSRKAWLQEELSKTGVVTEGWPKPSWGRLVACRRVTCAAWLAPRDLRQLTKQGRNCYWHCRGGKSCGPGRGVGQDAWFPSSPFAFIEEVGHHEGHASQIEIQRCAKCEQERHDGKLSSQPDPAAKQSWKGPNWLSIRSFHLMSSRRPFECRCQAKSKPGCCVSGKIQM